MSAVLAEIDRMTVSDTVDLDAADLGVSRLEAQRRFYGTKFYRDLEDESTKLWTLSPEQLYLIFHAAA